MITANASSANGAVPEFGQLVEVRRRQDEERRGIPFANWNGKRVILFTEYRATHSWLQHILTANGYGGDRLMSWNSATAALTVMDRRKILSSSAIRWGKVLPRESQTYPSNPAMSREITNI